MDLYQHVLIWDARVVARQQFTNHEICRRWSFEIILLCAQTRNTFAIGICFHECSDNIFLSLLTGGTFALYSLLCRHAKVSTIPNQHKTDEELTTYSRQTYEENSLAAKVKRWLEGHAYKKNCLLILVLIGTCTAIGDGILTPAISGIHNHSFMSKSKITVI